MEIHKGLPRPKDLHLSLKNTEWNSTRSPGISSGTPVYSPVTDLANNLCELSTGGYGDTPKRRLSLSSTGSTPTPLRPVALERQLSDDAGISMESPSPIEDSPLFTTQRSFLKSSAVKRFQAMPIPFCGFEPSPTACHAQPKLASLPAREQGKFSMDDEENSQDSGVCMESKDKDRVLVTEFRFAEPIGLPPRRSRVLSDVTNSPQHHSPTNVCSSSRPISAPPGSLHFNKEACRDVCSPVKLRRSSLTHSPEQDDGDDGFLDLVDMEEQGVSDEAPEGLRGLFSGPVLVAAENEHTPSKKRQISRLPVQPQEISPREEREKPRPRPKPMRGLFRSPSAPRLIGTKSQSFNIPTRTGSYKRSEPCREGENTPHQSKRRKSIVDEHTPEKKITPVRRIQRCHSATEAMIKTALNRGDEQPDLIGDFSKPYCLPIIRGKHQDLKSITPETVTRLLDGEFSHVVEKAVIIDCRYPYEYNGGHIQSAMNLYTKDEILSEFLKNSRYKEYQSTATHKRTVLIFHCEFSSERGPNMLRFLRSQDREANKECYPSLHYPEIYLMEGGYKNFFEKCKSHCEPKTYLPMAHEDHVSDYKHFRAKSRSWAGEKGRTPYRPGLKL